ncbi:MAG: CotH kinase family protein [Oscillospiraceae bacterium]|nr:CotH kinase family protein [Oscillospiraceae bacterium]
MERKWIILALAAVMLVSSAVALSIYPEEPILPPPGTAIGSDEPAVDVFAPAGNGKLQLTLSETGHFFTEAVDVSIIASNPDAKIHYTTDGSEPTSTSPEYSSPFALPNKRNLTVITVKAIAVLGEEVSRTLVHTFIIGANVDSRFDTMVFVISTHKDNLYDKNTGIFIPGQTRTDYIKQNPGVHIQPPAPANYNWRGMEGERPAYIEAFLPDGTRVISQAAGIRAHGGWSRDRNQKSIRMIARREYSPEAGKFHYDFFPGETVVDEYDTPLTKFDQLILRNGANDHGFGMLRHEAGCDLARQAGLRVATPARPAAVFVTDRNGNMEYYGFAWLQVRMNGKYLQDVYGAPDNEFQIIGKSERWANSRSSKEDKEDIYHLNSYSEKDLTNDRIFAELEELMDIDDFLLYYAFETIMGNHDWPQNNLKRWRYTGEQTENLPPELDGRWRMMTFDLDWTLGLYENPSDPNKRTFQEMMNERNERYSPMLEALLKRPELADRFSMMVCDLIANVVTEENVKATIGRLYGASQHEINAAINAFKYDGWVSDSSVQDNHRNMIRFAKGRGAYMFKALRDYLGFGEEMFTVSVTGGEAVIGTQQGGSSQYFKHMTVPLRPVLPEFTVFDHWVLNGVKVFEPEITVSAADARNGLVNVELVTREEYPPLIFLDAYADGERNGCVLINPNRETTGTAGLYITNDLENPYRWEIPAASAAPDGTLELAGKGSSSQLDLMLIRMGFNVKKGRMLYLCDSSGTVLDRIIPS